MIRSDLSVLSIVAVANDIMCCRFGRKKPLVYCMITAAIASAGAVLFTMYDPGEDKGGLILRALKMCKEEKVNLTIPYY